MGLRARRLTARPREAYACAMKDESVIDLRRTQLLAVDTSLDDARRAIVRAARIPSVFAAELRELLLSIADLDRRVLDAAWRPPAP